MRNIAVVVMLASGLCSMPVQAGDFDRYGAASPGLVPIDPRPDIIFELGASGGFEPAYPGASDYKPSFSPLVGLERLHIPGLIDIGGGEDGGGLSIGPSFDIASARKSADHAQLSGLRDVDATYSAGARLGYTIALSEAISLEVFGQLRYGFGGAQGLLGEAGADLTATLTPELEIKAGANASFASESYMDAYFGVTPAESAATGGRLLAHDPSGGIQSVGVSLAARYEFLPDTFLNAKASYSRFVGTAYDSPIVQAGSPNQFAASLGVSRQFSITY